MKAVYVMCMYVAHVAASMCLILTEKLSCCQFGCGQLQYQANLFKCGWCDIDILGCQIASHKRIQN